MKDDPVSSLPKNEAPTPCMHRERQKDTETDIYHYAGPCRTGHRQQQQQQQQQRRQQKQQQHQDATKMDSCVSGTSPGEEETIDCSLPRPSQGP